MDRRLSVGSSRSYSSLVGIWEHAGSSSKLPYPPRSSVTSISSKSLSSQQEFNADRWERVVNEIQESERTFRAGLRVLDEVFRVPLREAAAQGLTPEVEACFRGLTEIERLSDILLASLEQGQKNHEPAVYITELARHLPYLGLFTTFVSSFPATISRLDSLRNSDPGFARILSDLEADPRAGKLRCTDWLLSVVQRVPRWSLLVRELSSCWRIDELNHLLHRVETIAARLDSRLRDQEASLALVELQTTLTGLPEPLLRPGRRLLKEGAFHPRVRMWLFNDAVLLASETEGRLSYSNSLDLEDVTPTADNGALILLSPVTSLSLCGDQSEVDEWITAIRTAKSRLLSDLGTLDVRTEHTFRRHRTRSLWATSSPFDEHHRGTDQPLLAQKEPLQARKQHQGLAVTHENYVAPIWILDTAAPRCMRCRTPFTLWRRRHHCRLCGIVCCHDCSANTFVVQDSHSLLAGSTPVRCCDPCYDAVFFSNPEDWPTDPYTPTPSSMVEGNDTPASASLRCEICK